jgi:hypothetical protein
MQKCNGQNCVFRRSEREEIVALIGVSRANFLKKEKIGKCKVRRVVRRS